MTDSGFETGRRRVRLLPAVARRVWHALTNASPEERAQAQRQWEADTSASRQTSSGARVRVSPPAREQGVDLGIENGRSITPPQI